MPEQNYDNYSSGAPSAHDDPPSSQGVPENLTREFSSDEWASYPEEIQQRISGLAQKFQSISREQKERHQAQLAKILGSRHSDSESHNGSGNGSPAKNGSASKSASKTWSDYDDSEWHSASRNAIELYEKALASPDDEQAQREASGITMRTIFEMGVEEARRQAAREAGSVREEITRSAASQQRTHRIASEVSNLVGQSAMIDRDHPMHKEKDEVFADLLRDASEDTDRVLLEKAAWQIVHERHKHSQGVGTKDLSRRLDVSGFRGAPSEEEGVAEDPRIVALRRQGKHREAGQLRLHDFLEAGNSRPLSRGR